MVPKEYTHEYVVTDQSPYEVAEGQPQGSQTRVGTLNIGRVVWTREQLADIEAGKDVSAYVEGIGTVSLNPNCLRPF